MKKAVLRLGEILRNETGRRVAIVARGYRAMTRLGVGIQMIAHDVAIRAGVRIVAQVRVALGINESECAEAERGADCDRNTGREHHRHHGLRFARSV